ncbi:MAG: sugar phosphate isomerase/epimerase [Victivallaceae bacterium]|nr:sugar phosphate isomerase/epimerase [Victivallaceae bacterium]
MEKKQRKYSVFLGNVGACADRYCARYSAPFGTAELFDRVATVPQIGAVDLVATPQLLADRDIVTQKRKEHNLTVVSIAADTFSQARWQQGSLSAPKRETRMEALAHVDEVVNFCREQNCPMLTLWLGQDGYDYLFQSDYLAAHNDLTDALRCICQKYPDITVALEYKIKEPRTHNYISTVGMAALLCKEVAMKNCKVILDFGHALLGYENPAESVAILKRSGDLLCHIHINDNYRLWDDDMIVGSVHTLEYLEFFYWLRRTGYSGWMTIDQFPYREDGRDAVAESAAWLDDLESKIDSLNFDQVESILKEKNAVKSSQFMRELLRS